MRVVLKVIVHDDGKHRHIRPVTTSEDEGATHQLNKFERVVNLYEIFSNESIVYDDDMR